MKSLNLLWYRHHEEGRKKYWQPKIHISILSQFKGFCNNKINKEVWEGYTNPRVRARGPFLESSETFRTYFGLHNSLCIFKTKASRGTKLCIYFNFYSLYNIRKDRLHRISGSQFYEWLFGPGKLSGLSRNGPQKWLVEIDFGVSDPRAQLLVRWAIRQLAGLWFKMNATQKVAIQDPKFRHSWRVAFILNQNSVTFSQNLRCLWTVMVHKRDIKSLRDG